MKMLTGGSTISARVMHGDYFEFEPTHQLIVATNHKPIVNSTEHATWRRLLLVPFPHRYADEANRRKGDLPIDRQLRHRLTLRPQREAMLAWLVAGAVAWHRVGLGECGPVRDATDEWRRSEDVLLRYAEDRLVFDPTYTVASQALPTTIGVGATARGARRWR